ncbi:hypothetical protein ABK040_007288 [Willaertia magna]
MSWLLLNINRFVQQFNVKSNNYYSEWLNDKFEFPTETLLENADKRVEEEKAKGKEILKLQDEYLKELLGDNLLEDSLSDFSYPLINTS